jgi:hypothetical protein
MDQIAIQRRNAPRTRVLRGGVISFHRLGAVFECTVRNLSDTGACLMVESPVGIPNEFDLVLDREKVPRRCHVVWRSANKIGVAFQ